MSNEFLTTFWYLALSLVWGIYLFQESFVTGGSFLALFTKDEETYKKINKVIGTHWDGIQVWMILAVGGTFASFPLAFGSILSSLYIPFFLLMYALIIRGLAIELIYKTDNVKLQKILKYCLAVSSLVLILVISVYLQTVFIGVPVNDSFFSFLVIFLPRYLLGALAIFLFAFVNGYLYIGLNIGFDKILPFKKIVTFVAIASTILFIMTIQNYNNHVAILDYSNKIYYVLPILALLFSILHTILVITKKYAVAFGVGILFCLSFVFTGFVATMPNMVVYTDGSVITIQEAAAGQQTLQVMFVALLIFLPIVLAYQGYKYYRFWGKA